MKIATWNVNSILARMPVVLRWLESVNPDVLCMQETKCTDDKFPADIFRERGYQSLTFGQQTYNGVAILSRLAWEGEQRGFADDAAGSQARLLVTKIEGLNIVNVYVPNGQMVGSEKYAFKLDWLKRLRIFFDEHFARRRPFCCVATLMWPRKNATYMTFVCGRAAYYSAMPNGQRFRRSRIGDSRMHFDYMMKRADIIRGGTIVPERSAGITD